MRTRDLMRSAYYFLFEGRSVKVKGDHSAAGRKWIVKSRFGMAYYRGYYEPKLTRFVEEFIGRQSVFVDAGAHAGYFSLIAASKSIEGRVISFEPEPSNYTFICQIRQINGLRNWTVVPVALSAASGVLRFETNASSSMGKIASSGALPVNALSLDEYLSSNQIEALHLLKIDVEGHGGSVLRGAMEAISKFKPVILMEIHKGSDELYYAIRLLHDSYKILDFDTGLTIPDPSVEVDFVLLTPK